MEISEVRVKMVDNPNERLQAFCSITLDGDFVIRDLKVIEGSNGAFVAMPSRKLADRCPRCSAKNHLRARFCNECGNKLNENRAAKDGLGRAKLHADIAHPINAACRERIQHAVIEAYEQEKEAAKHPDYKPKSFDDFDAFETSDEPEMVPMAVTGGNSDGQAGSRRESDPPSPRGRRRARSRGRQQTTEKPKEAVNPEVEPLDCDKDDDSSEFVSDYNALIADLKKDAADRRDRRSQSGRGSQQDTRGRQDHPARQEPRERRDHRGERPQPEPAPACPPVETRKVEEPEHVPPPVEPKVVAPRAEKEEDSFTQGLF